MPQGQSDSKPCPGIATLLKSPKLRHHQACSQNKGLSRASQQQTGHGERGQPGPEEGNHVPREASSTKMQAGFIANQDFLGFWTVNIRLRRCTGCTPRKASSRAGRGNISQWPRSPNTWSPAQLKPGKDTKRSPNRVFVFEEYPSTWTWAA